MTLFITPGDIFGLLFAVLVGLSLGIAWIAAKLRRRRQLRAERGKRP